MRTYKFRLYPSAGQEKLLIKQLDLCRELYNAFLEQRILAYKTEKRINYNYQQDQIPELKSSFPEFKDIHSQVLQDVARRLDRAYDNFYRRIGEKRNGKNIKAGFPRFKSKDRYNSITYPQSGFRILDNGHIRLSKIGEVRMFMHRPVTGEIKTLSVKRDRVGDWFITITVDMQKGYSADVRAYNIERPCPDFTIPVGIDLGLKAIITTSDGVQVDPPKLLRESEKKLKRAQRNLSRKKKGSGNRTKAKRKVAKIHRKIERQRDDFSHKVSWNLVETHDLIVFENLNIAEMVKNHHLAKSIGDASWDKIVQYTTYKAESAGAVVVLVDPRHTSRECSRCGNIKHDLKLSDRIYHCEVCDLTMDRDLNAAINIRNRGIAKVGRGTPEFTPVEIGALPAMATPVVEAGSPLR
ncbi:MAG: transposase [Candidatus Thermoplasmatota archaeon]|nr:transposase [Candidatus Thermoplasmatota archaeon]